MMNQITNMFKSRLFKNIFIPWGSALLLLFFYYSFIQFPMERSFVKGLDHLRQNELVQASEEFKKVLRVYPKYEPYFLNIANYYSQKGRSKESRFFCSYARRLCLINSEIFSERGMVYSKYRRNLAQGTVFYNDHVVKHYLSRLFYLHEKSKE